MSEKIFRWLLRCYPRRFRDEYGEAMWQLFRDRLRAEAGVPGRVRLWIDLLLDTVVSVPREHRRPRHIAAAGPRGYRLSEEAVAKMVRRSHIRQIPAVFLSLAAGFLVAWLGNAPLWLALGIYGLLMLLLMPSLLGIGRFQHGWRTYELVLEEGSIHERHAGRAKTLHRAEVTRLVETSGLGFAILTGDPRKSIWVPSVLNGYEDLRSRLADWAPFERLPDRRQHLGGHLGLTRIFAVYLAAMIARSPYFVAALAAFSGMFLLHYVRAVRANSIASRLAWVIPAVLLAILILKVVWVLR